MTGAVERAEHMARERHGRLTPFRVGLVAKDAGLLFNPYVAGSHASDLFEQGLASVAETWPCGHPKTPKNTQSVGKAGFRCRECRRRISRESARKMRIIDPERIKANARRNSAACYARLRAKARGDAA